MSLEDELKNEISKNLSRRHFLNKSTCYLGYLALGSMLAKDLAASEQVKIDRLNPLEERIGHRVGKAKRVIYLHMAGSPTQLDHFLRFPGDFASVMNHSRPTMHPPQSLATLQHLVN